MISSVDIAVKIRDFLLDASDGAPEHPLPAAAVVSVRMEEPDGSVPPASAVDWSNAESKKNGRDERNNDHRQHLAVADVQSFIIVQQIGSNEEFIFYRCITNHQSIE